MLTQPAILVADEKKEWRRLFKASRAKADFRSTCYLTESKNNSRSHSYVKFQ